MKIPIYRYCIIALLFIAVCGYYIYLGVDAVNSYEGPSGLGEDGYNVTYETVYAVRGEIYDRNGVPLCKNEYSYNLILEYDAMPSTKREINDTFLYADYVMNLYADKESVPASLSPFKGMYPDITYDPDKIGDKAIEKNLEYIMRIYGIKKRDCDVVLKQLLRYYGLLAVDESGNRIYSDEEVTRLLHMRYDCDAKKFGPDEPYLFCSDISSEMLLAVESKRMQGLNVEIKCSRVYPNDGVATHLIGRLGKIDPDNWEYYKALGYRIDATVGVSGCEKAFESYLHGENGKRKVVRDENGIIVSSEIVVEPKKGNDVYLTIDIELQRTAEKSLEDAVKYIVAHANPTSTSKDGSDASAASAVVIHPETFELLAIASYPSYTMEQYENDYATLMADPTAPMFFRAVNGTYAPGSTFKVGMSVAALETGTITPYTTINTTSGPNMSYGKYTYYKDYQPTCWIRNMYGGSHGTQNVQAAIKNSCNLFFFEMGRLMGIETMNDYCKKYGLGQHTGIEISESTGVLAGPDYRDKYNLNPWTGGDTIAAAIGQSDNLFTPLQLCSYLSMIMNGGNRYNAHLLYQVKNYGSDVVLDTVKKELLSSVPISESTLATIKRGMREVLTSSPSTRQFFADCPVEAILKTGTAEVGGTRSHNATMIGYGENAEKGGIAVSVVIEQGMSGSNCGIVVNAIMKQYFGSN